ncbi:MAG: ATP-binding protein [Treponema sp.]|nr:ATP-binding protein [Treponema sp.]
MLNSTAVKRPITQNQLPRTGYWSIPVSESQIIRQDRLLRAINSVAFTFFSQENPDFNKAIENSLGILGRSVNAEQVIIWKNYIDNNKLCVFRLAMWNSPELTKKLSQMAEKQVPNNFSIEEILPNWNEMMMEQCPVYISNKNLHEPFRSIALNMGIRSVLLLPIFSNGNYWGFITFITYTEERLYSNAEKELLRSGGILIASAIENNKSLMELKLARDEAQSTTQAKSEFLSSMSHELRTPLNAIIGMTEIAKMSPAKTENCLEVIGNSSRYLLEIINDILDISKIEANKLELEVREFNFEKMFQNVNDVIRVKADEKKIRFVREGNVFERMILGDELRFSQVFLNLLSNSVKFTPEGGTVSVKFDPLETNNKTILKVEVKDSGIGMSKEQQEKLFKPFAQADMTTTRKYGGTGLGLVICKQIINLMGGDIWIESEIGKGTSFNFEVKINWGKPITTGKNKHDDYRIPHWQGKTILLAEDNEINREIINSLLEETGITIENAVNGADAVAKFKKNPGNYSLILMDIQMPVMNGLDATREIRKLETQWQKQNEKKYSERISDLLELSGSDKQGLFKKNPNLMKWFTVNVADDLKDRKIPIIAMTADVFTEDVNNCMKAGMNDHLAKPINVEKLHNAIREYLG